MFKLSIKSLIYYRKQYFWVFAGLVLAAAILNGALTVGSSVRQSLREMAYKRLGNIDLVIDARLNPASQNLHQKLSGKIVSAPLLFMPGAVSKEKERVSNIAVYGITPDFKNFFNDSPKGINEEKAWIGANLAAKLKLKEGDDVVIRVSNNSLLPGDLPLTGSSDDQTALRLQAVILPEDSLSGRFSLHPSQIPAENIFVDLSHLQKNTNMLGLINLILIKDIEKDNAESILNELWTPADSGLVLKEVDSKSSLELVSNRVFLPDNIIKDSDGTPGISYMANEISFRKEGVTKPSTIPYSIVAALRHSPETGKVFKVLPELKKGEILLNEWTAEDLGAAVGDKISMTYYVDSTDGKLHEDSTEFTIKAILKPELLDRDLMPAFPGIADEEHCRDWEPGIPMDMSKIRDKDEKYWEKYKGTPKAIVSYDQGKDLWGNRYGSTTSLRWPAAKGKENIIADLRKNGPQASGLYLRDIRKEADSAASNGIDFGMLFASMSFFIIIAALILTSLLHAFHIDKRQNEMGIMLAAGFTVKDVKRRFLREGLILSLLALIPGIPLGIFYTSQVLKLLSSIWVDAIGTADIHLHVSPASMGGGSAAYIVFAGLTLNLVNRRFLRQPTVELLQGNRTAAFTQPKYIYGKIGILLAVAAVICLFTLTDNQFVLTSTLLLGAVLCLSHGLLERLRCTSKSVHSMNGLSIRNLSRQNARSLGAILLMTCGTYIVLFVASRQKVLNFSPEDKSSGTGGFEFMAQTSIPLRYKPDSKEAINEFGFDEEAVNKAKIASIRYHRGDDASCLNLNKAQAPQIYGISPENFADRFSLKGGTWEDLKKPLENGAIPVIGDENTVLWGLQLYGGTGSTMTIDDEKGRQVTVQIVGMLKSSMLQGALIMDRTHFDKLFPAESGYSLFLIDSGADNEILLQEMKDIYLDYGFSAESSIDRLKNFLKIEATYLVIFQMLGGLGLILGALGFGFIILRNVQDRQTEIATMKAVGFDDRDIFSGLLKEHLILLIWAVTAGAACAFICWLPLLVTNTELPISRILTILVLIVITGAVSCFVSAIYSLKPGFYQILKSE